MVLKILERGCQTLVGTFEESTSFGFVRPDDSHYGKDIFIAKKHCLTARQNDKVVVKLLNYGTERRNPEGEITEVLGNMDDPATDVTSILKEFGIEEKFPKSVLAQTKNIPDIVTLEKGERRTDYRSLLTVTIDGEDARDLDDAITLEKKGEHFLLCLLYTSPSPRDCS